MGQPRHHVGQRVSYRGALCTVRYIGQVEGTTGAWLGVEWDDAARGKHNGSHAGVRYFTCLSKSPTAASFVRPARPSDEPQSFVAALHEKYAAEEPAPTAAAAAAQAQPIVISGKVAEEKGFDKIRRRLAQLERLKVVILDGLRIADAVAPGERSVADSCPSIVHLDLSRNLLEALRPVVDICADLASLTSLSLNGNRFGDLSADHSLQRAEAAFRGVTHLALGDTLLRWEELCLVASRCPSLDTLIAGSNQLSSLPAVPYGSLAATLTSVNLEYNDFTAMSDLGSLAALTALRDLYLKGCSITDMSAPGAAAAVFPPALRHLDVSYNDIHDWAFVDALATHFPGLTSLRIAHNPVYSAPRDGDGDAAAAASTEESHMLTIARLAGLKTVNFMLVQAADRTNAELLYLSRIARQLAAVPEAAEPTVLARHPRWAELCALHGAPDVVRRREVNPSYLEARLVTVSFRHHRADGDGAAKKMTARIPKSYDLYAVKGIAGRLFGLPPLRLRLVWETGEWDPVARHDEREGDSSDDDDGGGGGDGDAFPGEAADGGQRADDYYAKGRSARWIKREVELRDGPKQLGYCVDGHDVTIRVEAP